MVVKSSRTSTRRAKPSASWSNRHGTRHRCPRPTLLPCSARVERGGARRTPLLRVSDDEHSGRDRACRAESSCIASPPPRPIPPHFVIVNCAGRTRSIVGAQSLINAGIPNRVAALRNGTMGWLLAELELDHGRRHQLPAPDASAALEAAQRARIVAQRAGVAAIDREQLVEWLADTARTTYRFDVRTPEEFAEGHLSSFRSAPGGQLVQETDVFAPVTRRAYRTRRHDGVRANMTASWLAQMGWDVSVLAEGLAGVSLVRQDPASAAAPGVESSRQIPATIRGHRQPAGVDAGLSRLGARSRRPTGTRRHTPFQGHLSWRSRRGTPPRGTFRIASADQMALAPIPCWCRISVAGCAVVPLCGGRALASAAFAGDLPSRASAFQLL